MRTDPERQEALYNDLTLQDVARQLGVTPDHVLALGKAGELEIEDYRLPGAKRGVYRVDPESVKAFRRNRKVA